MDVLIDVTPIQIETDRLLLRRFIEADVTDLYAYASVPGVGEMAGWPHHESLETSERILRMFLNAKDVLAIYHKRDRKVIGSVGLHDSWANRDDRFQDLKVKEIGYVLAKEYWGQGLMPEAVRAVIDLSFNRFGLDAMTCCHFLLNDQSRRVIEKCGFTFIKEGEYFSKQLQQTFDECKYLLLKTEWSIQEGQTID